MTNRGFFFTLKFELLIFYFLDINLKSFTMFFIKADNLIKIYNSTIEMFF